jgi:diguanylate cyclase (GGDEF)-like protein
MTATEEHVGRSWQTLRNWALWRRPRNWIVYTLCTEAITLVLVATLFVVAPVSGRDLAMFAILAVLGLVHAEATRKMERMRRTLSVTPHINMISVWLLPAALLLPAPLMAVLVTVLYVHLGSRSWANLSHVAPHRTAINTATVILSTFSAALAAHQVAGGRLTATMDIEQFSLAILAAVAAYFLVNLLIATIGLYLAAPEKATWSRLVGSYDDNALEVTTLCLGGLLGLVLINQPLLAIMIFFPMFVLQRSVLAKQLEELASKDQKTGLLNAVAWHDNGNQELSRASRGGREFSVLMIDLDFFKKINDTYGHLAGDDMLIALADLLQRETRTHDLVGRFGGEEFVVLLAGAPEEEALAAAERIRRMITELVVPSQTNDGKPVVISDRSASIGVATYPAAGTTLDEVLACADAAVYVAKREGRNRVVGSLYPESVSATPG